MQIKTATYEDVTLLSDIMVTSFRAAFNGFISEATMAAQTDRERCCSMMETIYRDSTMHFLLGDSSGMLIWQDTASGAEIMALHSLPESWGTGLGHTLLTEALSQIGNKTISLWTFRDNVRARRFYEKHGFHRNGESRISIFDDAPEVRYILIPQ